MTTRQYKDYKGPKKENLRDHMTRTESALNTLAEVAATELSQKVDPQGFTEQKTVANNLAQAAVLLASDEEPDIPISKACRNPYRRRCIFRTQQQ